MSLASALQRPGSAPAASGRGASRAVATFAPGDADDRLALSVWVRLLRVHGLMLRELRRRVPERLTLPQFDALARLQRRPAGMTAGELTRELLVTAGNVTGIVRRLVRQGLVERRPVPEDRRAVRLQLTPRARALMRRALPRHAREVHALLCHVPRAELSRLRELLGGLARGLEAE